MVMGSFPVQSRTACADEWVEHGRTGLLVPPEDPEQIEQALRTALGDDALVDAAAGANLETARRRLDQRVVQRQLGHFYGEVEQALRARRSGALRPETAD